MFDLNKLLANEHTYLAHIHNNKKAEIIKEHLDLTYYYFSRLKNEKYINEVVIRSLSDIKVSLKKGENQLSEEIIYLLKDIFEAAIYYHDIGKINPSFQALKMKNALFQEKCMSDNSNHSLLSSLIYIDLFYDIVNSDTFSKEERKILNVFLITFSYTISRHHGYLKDLSQYISKLEVLLKSILEEELILKDYLYLDRLKSRIEIFDKGAFLRVNEFIKKYIISLEAFYIINKLLYSLIVACDFYATSHYMNTSIEEFGIIKSLEEFVDNYEENSIIKGIREYQEYLISGIGESPLHETPINELRSNIFIESEENLLKNSSKNIFYLEAPTGSGKTINSLNLALSLMKQDKRLRKIFYVFPFNTLCDQTYDVIKDFWGRDNVAIINSVTSIKVGEEENINYDTAYLDRLFLHYPIVLTSHVNFFNYLFGNGRENNLPLPLIVNSVVILDEIQSYRIGIWKELSNMLSSYAKLFNIKFIIMSATLPKISLLADSMVEEVTLLEDANKYFSNPIFKDRVKVVFSLLDKGDIGLEDLAIFLCDLWEKHRGRILIEFIKKATAREFFNILREKLCDEKDIYELSGDDSSIYRKHLIGRLKEKKDGEYVLKDIILVSTQVIEAGVDIDMDIGFKDISLIEAEEQFAGRINRSCNKAKSRIYFFKYDDSKDIYKGDIRTQYNIVVPKYRDIFINKDFKKYYLEVMKEMERIKAQANENSYQIFNNALLDLNYYDVANLLKLIDTTTYSIYLAYTLVNPENGEEIDGRILWRNFKDLLFDNEIPYAEKQIRLSQIKEKMNYFIYQINREPTYSDDEDISDITYLDDGESYIDNGKFDRQLLYSAMFKKQGDDIFL